MTERSPGPGMPLWPAGLSGAGVAPATEMLARAFFDDPMFTFLLPDAARRPGPLRWFLGRGVEMGRRYGLVDVIPGPAPDSAPTGGAAGAPALPAGVAVWLRPGHTTLTPLQLLRAGVAPLPLRFGLDGTRRFLAFVNHTEAMHHRAVTGPHWYLLSLATHPARRRAGVGGALVRHGTARAAAAGLPCYLETMNATNLPFYGRHGFEVVREDTVPWGGPGGDLRVWGLRRPPGASARD